MSSESRKSESAVQPDADSELFCAYCGLPVGSVRRAASDAEAAARENLYCCYGCRFAHAVVQESRTEGEIRWTVVKLGLSIFFTMNLMAFTMTMWSLDVYDVQPDPFQQTLYEAFRRLSMVLALPVLILLGLPILRNGFASLRSRQWSTDLLVGVAVLAAYATSVVNVLREQGSVYFEVGATVLVMMTLGRWIEATGKHKATETLDRLLTLLPATVTRLNPAVGEQRRETETPADTIACGDLVRVRAGQRFPTDGVIETGHTTVDEQVFSGESTPESRSPGDAVLAGTVNLDGDVVVQVTAEYRRGSFGRLVQLMQEARSARGYYQRMAERAANWFFPLVTLIALGSFALHLSSGLGAAIHTGMSVLLIACPCALGLATPLAVWTALSTAMRHQVLFRSGEAIEQLAGATDICFDKTGTLTTGTPQVAQQAVFVSDSPLPYQLFAHELARASTHPFSLAVVRNLDAAGPGVSGTLSQAAANVTGLRTVPGGGVEAMTADGKLLRLGSPEFACCEFHRPAEESSAVPDMCINCRDSLPLALRLQMDRFRMAADNNAASIVLLSVARIPRIGFLISETLRPEAATAVCRLRRQNVALHVLSGDRPAKGRFLQQQLAKLCSETSGSLDVTCGLTPDAKVAQIRRLRSQLAGSGRVVMVGDGINDAPALAASDVGIAMGCGADVSRDSAQVCLLSNDLTRVPWAVNLARRTRTVIRQNLFWAFGYNTVGVAFAASGALNPALAAGLMIASSLLVISNSLRLLRSDTDPASPNCEDGNVGSTDAPTAVRLSSAGNVNSVRDTNFDRSDSRRDGPHRGLLCGDPTTDVRLQTGSSVSGIPPQGAERQEDNETVSP
ncbi:MAG: cation-translocating P-type ATPase [Planctomycetaceae bacterium]|nr:cation-translocating P-type ATPase [Planctomycetaceae bacterium]